jgi:sodium/bile acid cotransporter 7
MSLKKPYLPVGLLVAVAISLALPVPGAFLKDQGAVAWFIAIIFLINGYQIRGGDVAPSKRLFATLIFAAILSLALAPMIGAGLARTLMLPAAFAIGLVVMSAVPPTLSSGIVITEVCGGSTAWALLITISLNALGVLVIPFTLKVFLATGADVTIDPLPLLKKLMILVILPCCIGALVKRLTKPRDWSSKLRYVPSTCVILTVLASLSASRETLLSTPVTVFPVILLAAIAVHLTLLLLTIPGAKLLRLKPEEGKALMFVGSQKTLPIAISVLAVLGGEVGQALIVCMVFHFSQLIIDSFIAARMAK